MDDDAVELVVVGLAEEFGIGAHGVEADDNVAVDDVVLHAPKGQRPIALGIAQGCGLIGLAAPLASYNLSLFRVCLLLLTLPSFS